MCVCVCVCVVGLRSQAHILAVPFRNGSVHTFFNGRNGAPYNMLGQIAPIYVKTVQIQEAKFSVRLVQKSLRMLTHTHVRVLGLLLSMHVTTSDPLGVN